MSFFPFFFWRPKRKNSGRKASWWRRASAPNAHRTACAVIPTVPRFYLPFFFRYLFWAGSFPSWQGQTFTCDWHPGWGGRTNQLWIAGSPPKIFPLKVLALFFVGRILEVKHCWTKWIFLEWNLHPRKWTWNLRNWLFCRCFFFFRLGPFLGSVLVLPGVTIFIFFYFIFFFSGPSSWAFAPKERKRSCFGTSQDMILQHHRFLKAGMVFNTCWSSYICYMLYVCVYTYMYIIWKYVYIYIYMYMHLFVSLGSIFRYPYLEDPPT